jgi:RNA polymerase sigma factor FliA
VDGAARRHLIEANLHLAEVVARKLRRQVSERLELDDLVAYGQRGLVEAAQRFDPGLGVSFATFAWYRVRGAMFDGLREMGQLRRGEYARLQLACEPALLAALAVSFVTSLDALAERGIDLADEQPPADERAHLRHQHARVRRVLGELPAKERHFIEKHYFEEKSLLAAGKELGLSKSWASRLHARAVGLLRERLGG